MAERKKSGGGKKIGKNKTKCQKYRVERRRFKNKLRRVRKCNGPIYALEWEKNYKERSVGRDRVQEAFDKVLSKKSQGGVNFLLASVT